VNLDFRSKGVIYEKKLMFSVKKDGTIGFLVAIER
jgi:hypothetical protein